MAIQINNRILVDAGMVGGLLLTASVMFFDVREDVALNAQGLTKMEQEVQRIDKEAEEDRKEILDAVKDNRKESAERDRRIEDKLDRLIERKLDENDQ